MLRCINRMVAIRKIWMSENLVLWKTYQKPKIDLDHIEDPPVDFPIVGHEIDIRDLEDGQEALNLAKRNALTNNVVMDMFNNQGT